MFKVLTGRQRFFGDNCTITNNIVTATPLIHPPDSIKLDWFPDDVRDLICKCRSLSWGSRPNLNVVMDVLNEAGDAAELRSRGIKEEDVIHLLKNYKGGHEEIQKAQAQRMVDMLSSVSRSGNRAS